MQDNQLLIWACWWEQITAAVLGRDGLGSWLKLGYQEQQMGKRSDSLMPVLKSDGRKNVLRKENYVISLSMQYHFRNSLKNGLNYWSWSEQSYHQRQILPLSRAFTQQTEINSFSLICFGTWTWFFYLVIRIHLLLGIMLNSFVQSQ